MSLALKITRSPCLPLRLRKKIGNLIRIPEGQNFSMSVFGHTYDGTTNTHLDRKVFTYGLHEPATIRLIRQLLLRAKKNGPAVYLDIGTNTGLHLLAAAEIADQAYGFEPWEKVRTTA